MRGAARLAFAALVAAACGARVPEPAREDHARSRVEGEQASMDADELVVTVGPEGGAIWRGGPRPWRKLWSGARAFAGPLRPGHREVLVVEALEAEPPSYRLWLMNVDDPADRTLLVPQDSRIRGLDWSPDGRFVVYESGLGPDPSTILRVDLLPGGGRDVLRLTRAPTGAFEPSVTADGRHVVFAASVAGDVELLRVPAGGGRAERLTERVGEDRSPAAAPVGRALAHVAAEGGTVRVRMSELREDGLTPTGVEVATTTGTLRDLTWNRDATRLALTVVGEGVAVWVVDARSGEVLWRSPAKDRAQHPAWSSRGALAVTRGEPEATLVGVVWPPEAASRARRWPFAPAGSWLPRWLPRAG